MRRVLAALVILALPILAAAGDATTKPLTRPDWCQPGWACIPTKELAADARYKIDLEEKLALAEARLKARRLFGWHTTCGIGIAGVVDENFNLRAVPAGYCGVGYGF